MAFAFSPSAFAPGSFSYSAVRAVLTSLSIVALSAAAAMPATSSASAESAAVNATTRRVCFMDFLSLSLSRHNLRARHWGRNWTLSHHVNSDSKSGSEPEFELVANAAYVNTNSGSDPDFVGETVGQWRHMQFRRAKISGFDRPSVKDCASFRSGPVLASCPQVQWREVRHVRQQQCPLLAREPLCAPARECAASRRRRQAARRRAEHIDQGALEVVVRRGAAADENLHGRDPSRRPQQPEESRGVKRKSGFQTPVLQFSGTAPTRQAP